MESENKKLVCYKDIKKMMASPFPNEKSLIDHDLRK